MVFHNDKVTGLRIAYIGGGSRGWAWGLMSDLAAEPALNGTVSLYDIDHEAAKHNEIIGNNYKNALGAQSVWKYKAVKSLKAALAGADFVVISILPGTFDEMESDVHTPEKYGIYQPVGDSTGPGGLIRAYRTIPMFIEIAEAIMKYAPDAWVINYTNPMTLCVRTLYEVFPKIKAFGCCHEVKGTQALLAQAISEILDGDCPGDTDFYTNVQGVNHFTWINEATWRGVDLLPVYDKFIDYVRAESIDTQEKDNWANKHFRSQNAVKFDLFKRYGVIAAAGDRHLVEFLPAWYVKTPEVAESWSFGLTTVKSRKEGLQKRLAKSEEMRSQKEPYKLRLTGEEGVKQIKALLGLGNLLTNVNIPNSGQLSNLPNGPVVETNALFTYDNVIPVNAGDMQWDVKILVERIIHNQETILKAVFTGDKELGFRAFLGDPQMCISMDDAHALYEEMIANTKQYIPWIK
ncbi:MAG: alpha-glucosidase/alpha-galactosidase [Oscillospiraceae bacterium]|jgi:alpha-galactosidase|nr:alpha-glucosidase/alpha-galactosidase [Oscillospiraceae bacterium]